ncbi:nuclear transport factor 2 family protein [Novosphingobium sp. CECT 9465]|uniref:nuclear transport factor 2 family protein n=1 Tax=Novosphingobium sp. CECT 9465 TaxID=2829794 RepID=UPI001E53F68F|nr:nuclear transport factor 2 family protein [Novosphingobium sp. CECT 9465]
MRRDIVDHANAVDRIVEERAIERIVFDYAYYLDMNMPEKMIELFVDDCEVSYAPNFGATGIEDYAKTLDGIGTFFRATSHHVSNIVIDWVSDSEATLRAAVLAIHRYTKERPDGILYGQYHDVVVKQDGQWKFKKRILKTVMTTDYHVRASNPIGRVE